MTTASATVGVIGLGNMGLPMAEHLLAAGGPDYGRFGTWLGLLALYDSVFLLVGYATFDFLLED